MKDAPEELGRAAVEGIKDAIETVVNMPEEIGESFEGAASWTGEQMGEVEENTGEAVDDVQQYGDEIGDSYDRGREEGRWDD